MLSKAAPTDFLGRFREVISDPVNLLIERVPMAGFLSGDQVVLHNGLRVPISGPGAYYGALSQLLIVNRGVHEPLEEFVFQELLKRLPDAPTMIELGAYWGHYSMWFKKARPNGQVILVEPALEGLKSGQDNFARNGLNGEFIQAFVGKGKFEIDDFFRQRNITNLDILHADIEGFECEMLEGAHEVLARHGVRFLFIATHSQDNHEAVVRQLGELRYRVEIASDFNAQTTSCDGMVFASAPNIEPIFGEINVLGREDIANSSPAEILKYLSLLQHRQCPLRE